MGEIDSNRRVLTPLALPQKPTVLTMMCGTSLAEEKDRVIIGFEKVGDSLELLKQEFSSRQMEDTKGLSRQFEQTKEHLETSLTSLQNSISETFAREQAD